MSLKVKSLGDDFRCPTRNSELDAGYDIYSAEDCEIEPGKRHAVSTQMAVAVPHNHYGRVAPRSGLAFKHGIDVLAGVCDSGYRGEIKVILINFGDTTFRVEKGMRIAQLVLEKISILPVVEVEELDETDRGEKGFGSSGK